MIRLWDGEIPGYDPNLSDQVPGLRPFIIDSGEMRGAVIVCPGGGYQVLAEHEGEPIARWLNSVGVHAFVLNYRVAPYRHPYPLIDAQRAIRYVRYHASGWNIDPDRIGILGFSAGGHLVSTAGTHWDRGLDSSDSIDAVSCRPDAMILCYPVISFGEFGHIGSMHNLLGPSPDQALISLLSNETLVAEDTPPAFLWHTADDEAVSVENSLAFAAALSRNRVPFELHVFETGRHGLGLAPDNPDVAVWTDLCADWLRRLGFCGSK